MKLGAALLTQLEQCGWAAQLADQHREIREDKTGIRAARTEIARAFAAGDEAHVPEANAALRWLMSEPGNLVSVGDPLDLIDETTGEVLATGRPGAVFSDPCLVVRFLSADAFDVPEPECDLGLLALGLAACNGQAFRVATVALRDDEVFPRRSNPIEPAEHGKLLARIKAAASRPRIPCTGEWCGECRQNVYCEAWRARATTALTVVQKDVAAAEVDDEDVPKLEITDENAGILAERLKYLETVAELMKEQLKSFVRRGGRCVVDGKEYYPGQRSGKETADVSALKAAGLTQYIKKGDPYEQFGWRKVKPMLPTGRSRS